jgi:hypothetical protein
MAVHFKGADIMLRFLVLLALLAVAGPNDADCAQTIKGSGVVKTETRPVGKFTAIELEYGRLTIEQTGTESLTVTADDNILPLLTTDVKGGTLTLSVVNGTNYSGAEPVYVVTVAALRSVELDGSGEIQASKLDGETLSVAISGSGSAKLAGRATELTLSIEGSGSIDATQLRAKRAKAEISGSGSLTVNASDELDADISGAGTIWYLGSPKVKSDVSGSGSIERK